ncbi:MAG: FAD-dependent oxidoreductase [Actinobacteria bacterium]|nr:FAD-dependent oxidoreductase [Actinomycetota bacterium]MCL6095904.1 FAD-dependent oxidoreductase [Actinomycetota bacterium]
MPAEIVILGGGVGGALTANLLAKKLPAGSARIRVVDATGQHLYQPGFLYIALDQANAGWLSRDLRSLLPENVEIIIDKVAKIDTSSRKVNLELGGALNYDYLVIATGSRPNYEGVSGLKEGAYSFYSLTEAERLREALRTFKGGTLVIGVAGMPYKCPPAPVEFAFLVEEYLRKKGVRDKTTIKFLSPLNRAFTIESASALVAPMFAKRGIELNTFVNIDTVDPSNHEVHTLEDEVYSYDLAVLVPPHSGADALLTSGITDSAGWLPTDPKTLRVEEQEDVFAIGDATNLPISKSGSTAHFEAPVIVEQIAAAVEGRVPHPKRSRYGGKVTCFLETGNHQATILVFDYDNPPKPPRPSVVWHGAKWGFNRAYWFTVPKGRGV